nr:PKD domain-containing protein [uncultured Carboxylicivirga sp.]
MKKLKMLYNMSLNTLQRRNSGCKGLIIPIQLIFLLFTVLLPAQLFAGNPPTADFSVDNATPVVDETITFTDQSSIGWGDAEIDDWEWSFGEGANPVSSRDQNPSMIYETTGLKTVELRAHNDDGWSDPSAKKTNFIKVTATYYSTGVGDPSSKLYWNTRSDGSGREPSDFTSPYQTFIIQSGDIATTTTTWSIEGVETELIIESGGTLVANNEISVTGDVTFRISDGATYEHNNNTTSIWDGSKYVSTLSVVSYGYSGDQFIEDLNYGNLIVKGGGNKTLQGNTTINGNLDLSSAKIVLDDYDLTLGSSATITGSFSEDNMIVTNGAGVLVKEGSSSSDFVMIFPLGTEGLYSPFEITSLGLNSEGGSVSVRAVDGEAPGPPAASSKDLQKYWKIDSDLDLVSADVSFTYNNSEVGPDGDQSLYALQVYSGGAWVEPVGASSQGYNPMTASGITDLNGIWTALERTEVITYYSYRSGDWNAVSTWTHDPGGTTQTATDIPGDDAKVIILNGRTVNLTSDVSNTDMSLAIQSGGFVNMSIYRFTNTLSELSGNGNLKLASANFPNATNNYLVTANGGTVEYNNSTNFELTPAQSEYNHLIIDGSAVATQKHDITIHGDLHVKQGNYRINDGNPARYRLTIEGDVKVDNGGFITVGEGNTTESGNVIGGTTPFTNYYTTNSHTIVINGDFINNGSVRFTNQSYPEYDKFTENGAATVYFRGASDNTLTCNNQTDFYNLVLDKGIDQTFKLTVYSSAYSNFRLFGRNTYGGEGGGANPNLRKALWIRTGTLVLQGLTVIPSLTEGGDTGNPNSDYYIPVNGALVLDGSDVVVLTTADDYAEVNAAYNVNGGTGTVNGVNRSPSQAQSFSVYGKVQIKEGYLSTRESGGIIIWNKASAEVIVDGGILDIKQFRSGGTEDGLASYVQNGGRTIFRGRFRRESASVASVGDIVNSSIITDYSYVGITNTKGSLSIDNPDNIFSMSGGIIEVLDVSGTNNYAIDIFSAIKNINVTGGTIKFSPQKGDEDMIVRSSAPFGNFVIQNAPGCTTKVKLESNTPEVSGNIEVLGNLEIVTGTLDASNFDVAIGGDFSLASGTNYTGGSNHTIFNGNEQQKLIMDISSLTLNKLVVDKSSSELLLGGSLQTLTVNDSLIIRNGDLNCDTKNLKSRGNIFIGGRQLGVASGRISVVGDAGTPQTISGNGNGEVYYLRLNTAKNVSLSTNLKITGTLDFKKDNSLFDIGTNNLSFAVGAVISNGGPLRYIKSAGNAGDGGITFAYNSTAVKTWPIGVDVYSPAEIGFTSAPSTYGDITIIPVNYEHPTTTTDGEALSYFWRIKANGFSGFEGKVSHRFNYDQSDVHGTELSYMPARYDVSKYEWNKGGVNDVNENSNQINAWTTPTQSADYIEGDFTAGLNSAFGTPTKYYSRANGLWRDASTWSTTGHDGNIASNIPGSGDIVIIGNGNMVSLYRSTNQYGYPNRDTKNYDVHNCSSLQIEAGSVLDVTYNPASNFGMVVSHPNGNGVIRISTAYSENVEFEFPSGDFSDFNANQGTTEFYTLNPDPSLINYFPEGVREYGNLTVTLAGASNIVFANHDVHIKGNLTMNGTSADSWFCPTWGSNGWGEKTITIDGNLDIKGGSFFWNNNSGTRQDVVVNQDVIVAIGLGGIGSRGANNQTLSIGGDFINNSAAYDSYSDTYGCDLTNIPLIFFGDNNAKISSTEGAPRTRLESITVNKGTSQATILTMDITGTVNYESDEWLKLVNGTFIYNRNANVSIYSGNSFTIPGSSGLTINTSNSFDICRGNNSNKEDVYLNGKLTILHGSVRIGDSSRNINNDIEYSGAGSSEIDVQGGSLTVNGQIRRNPASSAGVLKYNQSGGDVTINGSNARVDRAKLEILNVGSEFRMSGGTLTIVRGGGTTYGDLYLRPENSNVTGGDIIFDNSSVNTQNYLLDANVPLNNLTVRGNGANATVKLLLSPLSLNGDLTLSNSNSIFDANSAYNVNLTINGDFINNGVYNYYENTTTFNGVDQQISGSANIVFYNLVVDPLTTLTLTKVVAVNNQLTINNGTLAIGSNAINVKGDVLNNSSYTSSGLGLVLNGSINQALYGTGTFARLELDNSAGATLENDVTLNGELALTSGVLNIKDNLLSLAESASISGSFGVGNMITTNGVYSNKGVRKVISSGDSPAFTFPIGVNGKYTPAVLDLSTSDNAAAIQIHPVNYKHPANIDGAKVLDYFWAVESEALSNANGVLTFNYLDEDIQGEEATYLAARLLVPGSSWTKSDGVDEDNNLISFTVSGNNLSGEYTAGLETAFPDNVPEFTSIINGDWSNPAVWTQTGGDSYTLTGAPNGFIVVVDNEIDLDENFAQAYRTTINSTGKLKIDNVSYGHNLGTVSGSGTLYLEQGNLPEGNYDNFLGCDNSSTLEFGGADNYGIIADLFNNAANLLFSGTGTRILPDANLTICKQLIIDGPVLDNSVNNKSIFVKGSFTRLSGSFRSGSGDNATVSFIGEEEQFIGGFTGSDNTLNNLEINNSAGLTLNDDVEVKGKLLLTSGVINTSSIETLTITNTLMNCVTPASGKANSYVNGPLTKKMNQSDSFIFPIGIDGELGSSLKITAVQTGTKLWTAEYKRPNTTYSNFSFPLTAINSHEYWSVSSPGGGQANVQLGWNAGSDITPAMTEHGLTDIRVVNYDGANWQEINSSANGTDVKGQVITVNRVTITAAGSDFTTATVNTNKPKIRFNPDGSVCDLTTGIKVEMTSTVPTAADYEISYSIDGIAQTPLIVSSFPYYLPTPTFGVYELTGFKYDDKVREGVFDSSIIEVFPSPTAALAGDDQSLQGMSQTVLSANVAIVGNGVWSITSGTGGSFEDPTNPFTTFYGTAGTTYVLSWTITNGECQSVDQVNIAFPLLPAHTWIGNSNDWFDINNWTDGIIPDETADVTINAVALPLVNPVINASTEAKINNLDIKSGAVVTLSAGARMTVKGDITMEDDNSLIIHNNYTNPASFINHGTITGDVQVEWDYPRYMYLYISHCLNGVVTDDYGTVQSNAWVFSYPSDWSVPGLNSGITLTDNTKQLMGYSAYLADAKTVTTNGTMIMGAQTRELENGWMLLGNPYASSIDLDKTSEWDFGDASTTVWFTLLSNPKYTIRATYNVALGVDVNEASNIISPGQAFWIRAYSTGSNFTIYPEARVHGTGGLKTQIEKRTDDIFRLKLGNDNGSDEIAIVFRSIGSEFPNSYDSEKYMSDGAYIPLLYTIKGTKKMVIDVMPELTGELTVPLGYKVGSKADGMIKIIANNINQFKSDVSVLLEDTKTGAMYDLRSSSIVSFESGIATNDERFVLHFKAISTDIDNNVVDDDNSSKVNVKVVDFNNLEISCNWDSQEKLVEIYSIDGRQIIKDQMYGDLYSRYCEVKSGLYVVKVSDDKHSYQQKIRISKH